MRSTSWSGFNVSPRSRFITTSRAAICCAVLAAIAGCAARNAALPDAGGADDGGLAIASSVANARSRGKTSPVIVQPLYTGYFSDPYHVPYVGNDPQTFFGTKPRYLYCPGAEISPGCAEDGGSVTVDTSALAAQAAAAGATIVDTAGLHPYLMNDNETWIMTFTLHVTNSSGDTWSVIAHASPSTPVQGGPPPTAWTADTLLVGTFGNSNTDANYDGKYFQSGTQLYLIYQKELTENPHRDGIVAQAMNDPETLASSDPVTLLAPDGDDGPLESEWYYPDGNTGTRDFKLVETGNIRKINGKYLLAYSVGAYNRTTYKLAIAWADDFLGPYVKVTQQNPSSIWGTAGPEVLYLLQSEQPDWPNYVANQVLSPGVPTVAQIGQGSGETNWVLVFAGYDVTETESGSTYDAGHRRTRYVKLDFNVPDSSVTVAGSTNQQRKSWLTLHPN
jgi:hypothetical protein